MDDLSDEQVLGGLATFVRSVKAAGFEATMAALRELADEAGDDGDDRDTEANRRRHGRRPGQDVLLSDDEGAGRSFDTTPDLLGGEGPPASMPSLLSDEDD